MSSIIKKQNDKIKLYVKVLDITKVNDIINILKLFYKEYSIEELYNKIISFLGKTSDKELLDCEYGNASLDKIIIELFSLSNKDLLSFYKKTKINKHNDTTHKQIDNTYILKYISALLNKDTFNKTKEFLDIINELIHEYPDYDFINDKLDYFKKTNLYIDANQKYIDIEKLFLYLLNIPLIDLNTYIDNLGIYKLNFNSDKKGWTCAKKIDKDKYVINYTFHKLFNNDTVKCMVETTLHKEYIKNIYFTMDKNNKTYNYYYFSNKNLDNNNNIHFTENTLENAKDDFESIYLNKYEFNINYNFWNKYLYEFTSKPKNDINMLQLGLYNCDELNWFINFLLTNQKSSYIGIDDFIYKDGNIKKQCLDIIEKSNKQKQIQIISTNVQNAVNELYKSEIKINSFNIIYINITDKIIDVSSTILLLWEFLKDNGILVFDNYNEIINNRYFDMQISVDTFLSLYESKFDILYKGSKIIIRKKNISPEKIYSDKNTLKVQYTNWNNYLLEIINKTNNMNILQLGIFDCEELKWFTENLLINNESKYTAIDDLSNDLNKKKCYDLVDGKTQINIINKDIQLALHELYKKINTFDIIYINKKLVDITSNIIVCWNFIKDNGILIFDNYKNNISIDTFRLIYDSQFELLYKGDKYIIRKKNMEQIGIKINDNNISKLIHEIENKKYKDFVFKFPYKKKSTLPFNLTFMDKPDYNFYLKDSKIIDKIYKLKGIETGEHLKKKILQNNYLCGYIYSSDEFNLFYNKLLNNKSIQKYLDKIYINITNRSFFRSFMLINILNNNLPNETNYLSIMTDNNYSEISQKNYKRNTFKNYIMEYIKKQDNSFKNLNISVVYPKYLFGNKNIINNIHNLSNDNIIYSDVFNSIDIKNISKKTEKIYFMQIFFYPAKIQKESVYNNYYEYLYLKLLGVIFSLSLQEKNGLSYFVFYDVYSENYISIIEILRNYYETVEIYNFSIDNYLSPNITFTVKGENFRGINNSELDTLFNDKTLFDESNVSKQTGIIDYIFEFVDVLHFYHV